MISLIFATAFCTLMGSSPYDIIRCRIPGFISTQSWSLQLEILSRCIYLNISVKGFVLPRHWLVTNLIHSVDVQIACQMTPILISNMNHLIVHHFIDGKRNLNTHLYFSFFHASLASDHNLASTHLGWKVSL